MSLREPKKSGMFAALGIKRNPVVSNTSTIKSDKKIKVGKVPQARLDKGKGEEEGESDMEFVVIPDEQPGSARQGVPSPDAPSTPSGIVPPKEVIKSGLPPPSTRSRNLTTPIALRPTFDRAPNPAMEDTVKGGSVRLRTKTTNSLAVADDPGKGQTGLGRPKSTLGLGSRTERIVPSVRSTCGKSKNEEEEEEIKVERRRSMLWDRSAPTGSNGPAIPLGGAGQGLKHKRSVSALAGLSTPSISSTRPSTREPIKRAAIEIQGEGGTGERKTATGMLLRPRPGSVVGPSQRAGQVGSVVKPGNSVRVSKPEPVAVGSVRVALGSSKEESTVDKRMSRRRSMMYLGQGPGEAPSSSVAPIESSQSREVLKDEGLGSAEEVDVDSKRQQALDRLVGKGGVGLGSGTEDAGTPGPTRLGSMRTTQTSIKSDTPVGRTRATTSKMHERAGSTRSMRVDVATIGPGRMTRTPSGARSTTSMGLNGTAMMGMTTTRVRVGVSKWNVDLPGDRKMSQGGVRGRVSISTGSTTSTPAGTPRLQRRPPPSTGTSPTKTPSRRDPLHRLRSTPNRSTDARTRKTSNESDIDLKLEQSRRTWLGGLGGGDKESPLTGKVGELRMGSMATGSGRMRRMSSQGSGMGVGGDVFGKSLRMDSGSMIKIKALEAQLEALQTQQYNRRERAERAEGERRERRQSQVVEMMTDVVRACGEELRVLQRAREERERQVGLFEKAWEMAVASV